MKEQSTEATMDIKQQSTQEENETNNSQYGVTHERIPVKNTPFILQYAEGLGWCVGIAEHKITGWYKKREEAERIIKGNSRNGINWEFMTGVILVLIEKIGELKKLESKLSEK